VAAAAVVLALVLTIRVHPSRGGPERRGVPRGVATGTVVAAVFLLLATFVAGVRRPDLGWRSARDRAAPPS